MKYLHTATRLLLAALLGIALLYVGRNTVIAADPATRPAATKLMNDGNWKEAYTSFSALALDPADDPAQVVGDFSNAVACLDQLGNLPDLDTFREGVVAAHAGNWRLLQAVAQSYLDQEHNGFQISGAFERGGHRGGGKAVNAYERDRVRALQLMQQVLPLVAAEPDKVQAAEFHRVFADMLMGNRGYNEAWRLQTLTDLSTLPDYDDGYYYYWYGGWRGAPVNADGTPVYYHVPASWAAATNDGERWRWELDQVITLDPGRVDEIHYTFASFLYQQFGEETLQQYGGWRLGRDGDDTDATQAGIYSLDSLKENETLCRTAAGVKRLTLPDEFNFIGIFQDMAGKDKGYPHDAAVTLGQMFENRRQYDRAVDYWKIAGDQRSNIDQILNNWGEFEPVTTQATGQSSTVDFRFRNGNAVHFEAFAIDTATLLADTEAYIKTKPAELQWQQMDIDLSYTGDQLVNGNQAKYVKERVASWDLSLTPRDKHFDKRVTVTTPLTKAGAYLVTGKMANGNMSRIVIWVADAAIVKKSLDKQTYYFIADAVTGAPLPGATVDFFGYRQQWIDDQPNRGGRYTTDTMSFTKTADTDGQVFTSATEQPNDYMWVITAHWNDRMAYLGFTNGMAGTLYDEAYNETKAFGITDRPVYRPEQPVHFKFWVNTAKYDQEGVSAFAGKSFTVRITDPRDQKVQEQTYTADDFGGFAGDYTIPKDATLGMYNVSLVDPGPDFTGNVTFRVEEYKKPEYEVTVDAPTDPVMLGEKITATIKAKYYFGAPVTEAKVKYTVTRTAYSATWYPAAYWDWLYGEGYWWYAYDYPWYPGWNDWGCARPVQTWYYGYYRPQPQPEVVAQAEVPIGPDGTVPVEIDTAVAKAMQGDTDHRYEITAEVTDQSRRTITGTGAVLVARKPFKVYAWVDRGYYRVGDIIQADFNAQTLDNKGVQGTGVLKLMSIAYTKDASGQLQPVETEAQRWTLDTNQDGLTHLQIRASKAGQYRLSYTVTDAKGHSIEGGYVFVIRGDGDNGSQFRFNALELVTDKKDYAPGDQAKIMINTDRPDSTVLLFERAVNGVCLPPKVLHLTGQSALDTMDIVKKDMPNIFVEALTVSGGKTYSDVRELAVPPEQRILNVDVQTSATTYKPGDKAVVKIKVTDPNGNPVQGSTVVTMYDKSVEYISGGSNIGSIKDFFWKWRRTHYSQVESSLQRGGYNFLLPNEIGMRDLGIFGYSVANQEQAGENGVGGTRVMHGAFGGGGGGGGMMVLGAMDGSVFHNPSMAGALPPMPEGVPGAAGAPGVKGDTGAPGEPSSPESPVPSPGPMIEPTIRSNFADTAFWTGALNTDANGEATVTVTMPENLTTWKTRVWAMGAGTAVGEGSAEVVTTKNLIVQLEAPRFFTQKDEVVLSAIVHNYLTTDKQAQVILEMDGGCLAATEATTASDSGHVAVVPRTVTVPANGEVRVDWVVDAVEPGEATIRMKALTDEESDAMEMKFPVEVHGMLKTESFSGAIRPDGTSGSIDITVPGERIPSQSRLEVRYSPTLAGAMVDALPYLVNYPYGCTEQTLNRWLPTVITQKVLLDMGLDLKAIQEKRTNLNAQQIGNNPTPMGVPVPHPLVPSPQPLVPDANPVFDQAQVADMTQAGIERLQSMQCADGGWGWFSGSGECSYPHTTALVVHGLQRAQAIGITLPPDILERGVEWLKNYESEQVRRLKLPPTAEDYKREADAQDADDYMVLADANADNTDMRDFLYRDRNDLPVYAKAMFGLGLNKVGDTVKRDMLLQNIEQFLVQDDEDQTAYLKLDNQYWWYWYGSEYEAQAYYLKLLVAVRPTDPTASRLVKYLLNNRANATYWNSTRDTAICVEAFSDYLKATGEMKPDMTVDVRIDGQSVKTVKIDATNLFTYDNKVVLTGDAVLNGPHKIELVKTGTGPLYYNAYLTNFTLEDPITKAGLEIKVERKYYKLVPDNKTVQVEGANGQALNQQVQHYDRVELPNLTSVKSGDLLEVELTIASKNDYEYIVFEDMKPAGCEPVEVQSGYTGNEMGAYTEFRDDRVTFFVRSLARGTNGLSYRVRAETPGTFSALPTRVSAMYAPELKANSDEWKVKITD